jgi:hypothetical protein
VWAYNGSTVAPAESTTSITDPSPVPGHAVTSKITISTLCAHTYWGICSVNSVQIVDVLFASCSRRRAGKVGTGGIRKLLRGFQACHISHRAKEAFGHTTEEQILESPCCELLQRTHRWRHPSETCRKPGAVFESHP